jgi:hypothetical protein
MISDEAPSAHNAADPCFYLRLGVREAATEAACRALIPYAVGTIGIAARDDRN